MYINYKDSVEHRIKVLKYMYKRLRLIDYIMIIYVLSFLCANIFYFKSVDIYIMLLVFIVIYPFIAILKYRKNVKYIKERFLKVYGIETDMTIDFKDDKIIYIYNKTESKYTMFYEEVKEIVKTKNYLIIKDKYKSYIYIPLEEITNIELDEILNFFKNKQIKIK